MRKEKSKTCVFCWYARMREDIRGIYCTGGFQEENGSCRWFVPVKIEQEEETKKCGENVL